MMYPDKFTPLDESVLGKVSELMMEPGTQISLSSLREKTVRSVPDVGEFVLAMDMLFVLGKIDLDETGEIVTYAD